MTNHVLINNVEHNEVRVVTTRSAKFGDVWLDGVVREVGCRNARPSGADVRQRSAAFLSLYLAHSATFGRTFDS